MGRDLQELIELQLDRRKCLGARLAVIRAQQALTQAAFAEQLSISTRTYQDFEQGKRPVPSDVLIEISEAYSINLNWLLKGQERQSFEAFDDTVRNFLTALFRSLEAKDVNVAPEGLAAIISRWLTEFQNGRTIPLDDVHIWIEMMTLKK